MSLKYRIDNDKPYRNVRLCLCGLWYNGKGGICI